MAEKQGNYTNEEPDNIGPTGRTVIAEYRRNEEKFLKERGLTPPIINIEQRLAAVALGDGTQTSIPPKIKQVKTASPGTRQKEDAAVRGFLAQREAARPQRAQTQRKYVPQDNLAQHRFHPYLTAALLIAFWSTFAKCAPAQKAVVNFAHSVERELDLP